MSGLTVFFRRYLGDDNSIDGVPMTSTTVDTGDTILKESNTTSHDRINVTVEMQQQQPPPSRTLPDITDDHQAYQRSISTALLGAESLTRLHAEPATITNAANTISNSNATSFKEFIEWRQQQTFHLQEYMALRLFDTTSDTGTINTNPSTNDTNDNIDGVPPTTSTTTTKTKQSQEELEDDDDVVIESQSQHALESQIFASQPRTHVTTARPGQPPTSPVSTALVPSVGKDAYYMATEIQELDLYVHTFNAATLLPITKVWSRRTTLERRRRGHRRPSKKSNLTLPPWSFQYDGPLAVLYDRVLCMELFQTKVGNDTTQPQHTNTQLHALGQILDHGTTGMATTTPAVSSTVATLPNMTQDNVLPLPPKKAYQYMKIYWYDAYADLFHSILADAYESLQQSNRVATTTTATKKSTLSPTVELYLSLKHIPAKCIFPYYDECHAPSRKNDVTSSHGFTTCPDWYDMYHTVPYCICIGGDSAMIVQGTTPNPDDLPDDSMTWGKESQGSDDSTIDPTTTMDSTANIAASPIAFDSNDQVNAEPIHIKCYMIPHGGWNDENLVTETTESNHNVELDETNDLMNNMDRTMPNKIVEYTISTETKQIQMEIYHNPTDAIQIRSIWEEIQRQRPHLLLTKDSYNRNVIPKHSTGTTDRNLVCRRTTTNLTTDDGDDHPFFENENAPQQLPSTPGRMQLSELTSPGERLKRRRLIHFATDDIQYQLSDIPSLPWKTSLSFYAAILSFNQPYRTKRGDWTMSLQLVDDSLQLCEDGLVEMAFVHSVTCNIFVKPAFYDKLPMIRYAGDIVRLSNVHIQSWNNEIQLVSTKESTYVTLHGKGMKPDGTQTKPEMFPSDDENVVLSDMEWEHMLDMWNWAQRRMMLHATMKIAHRFRLSDMHLPDSTHTEAYGEANARGDLTAMVAAVIPIVSDRSVAGVTPRGFLRVWDGTGIPKSDVLPTDSEESRQAVQDGDPPTIALIQIAKIVHRLKELRQNNDIQPPAKLSGRVVNVAIWEQQHWELVDKGYVTVGSFIRLRNVQDTLFPNSLFRCLHVHAKSSLTPLPTMNFEVLHLLEEHNNRLLRMEPTNVDSGLLPLLLDNQLEGPCLRNPRQPDVRTSHVINANTGSTISSKITTNGSPSVTFFTSLKDFMEAPVPSVFIGDVDIVGMYPSPSDLLKNGVELICIQTTDNADRFYRFGLQLRGTMHDDRSALVSVIVSDDRRDASAGKQFFNISCAEAMLNSVTIIEKASELEHEKIRHRAQLTSIEYNASKYFLLDYLQ